MADADDEIRFAKDDGGEERLRLFGACVVNQQRAGFKNYVDAREVYCPDCGDPGYNNGWGSWQYTCGAEWTTDGEAQSEPCSKTAA